VWPEESRQLEGNESKHEQIQHVPLTVMTSGQLSIQTALNALNLYGDSRTYGYQGPTRNVRLPRATPSGGGAIAKSGDGVRCAVTGKECQ
jgi:hypothetical protein